MVKRRNRKGSIKRNLEKAEELNLCESKGSSEDLSSTGMESECFLEKDFDEKSVVNRVKLF